MPPLRLGKIGKTNVGWAIVTFLGIGSFVVAKTLVDKQRYEIYKSKERMRRANEGVYEIPGNRKFAN